MRKIASSLLFLVAAVGMYLVQIDFASSFDFRRFGGGSSTGGSTGGSTTGGTSGFQAQDPGVRGDPPGAGAAFADLTPKQREFFDSGADDFAEEDGITDGLGPRMNLDSCGGCHMQPALGGSSPAVNPQVAFASKNGGTDTVPSFIRLNGPVREARFVKNPDGSPDGGVHAIFTITGRTDANGCSLAQPDFATQLQNNNVIFRIPTPTFGAGLMEQIPDAAIAANQRANATQKQNLGIRGRPNFAVSGRAISGQTNNNGNDGTIARFGWKAQNKSLLLFSGEAYNVEMGITNELFQTERDETANCQFADVPNNVTNFEATEPVEVLGGIERFSNFMRFLDAPQPATPAGVSADSIANGKQKFSDVGCALCHTPSFTTSKSTVAALSEKAVNLFSDLLVHDMGPGLADGVSQGQAGPREFRTAPLWGLGQRVFFLHDGRTSNLIRAIREHKSGDAFHNNQSEANGVINNFENLGERSKQDLLNFLRSL